MLDFPSLIRFSSWFIPIPFMILYHVKTTKFDGFPHAFIFPFITFVVATSFLISNVFIGFRAELIAFYLIMLGLSYGLFATKYDLPQTLAISVCLTFFTSLYWEIPYHVYTVYTLGIQQAFALHVLYIFPLIFIWQKIKLKLDKLNFSLVVGSMFVSSVSLFFLLNKNVNIFDTWSNSPGVWLMTEILWFVVRFICFISLYIIFYRGSLRKTVCETKNL